MTKRGRFLVMLLLLFFPSMLPGVKAESLIISTGSEEGLYHAVGRGLAHLMNEQGVAEARARTSAGTIENLRRLASGEADLALVQGDVISSVLHGEGRWESAELKDTTRNLRAFVALYPEYTQILVRDDAPIRQPLDLVGRVIFTGIPGSGTRKNATDLLRSFGIRPEDYRTPASGIGTDEALEALIRGEVDAAFFTIGDLVVDRPEADGELRMLSLSPEEQRRIRANHPYYGFTTVTDRQGRSASIMFTRALLVSRETTAGLGLSDKQVGLFLDSVFSDLDLTVRRISGKEVSVFQDAHAVRGIPIALHNSAEKYFRNSGMLLDINGLVIAAAALWTFVIVMFIARYGRLPLWLIRVEARLSERFGPGWHNTRSLLLVAGHPVMLTLWVLVATLLTNATLIVGFETTYAIREGTQTEFAERSPTELLIWLLTFAATGFAQDMYPQSLHGKVAAALIPLLSLTYVVLVFFYSYRWHTMREEREARGECVRPLRKHVIICGWNARVPRLIREITMNAPGKKARKVVVIAEHSSEKPLAPYGFRPGSAFFLRGISSDHSTLEEAGIRNAFCLLIVADLRKVQRENLRSVFTALVARRSFERSGGTSAAKVIAEMLFEENRERFIQAKVNKIVPVGEVIGRIMTHACLCPGISDLAANILSYSTRHSLALYPVTDYLVRKAALPGKTFREALIELRQHNLLLLAVYKAGQRGCEHKESELEFRDNREGDASPYLVNPGAGEDAEYRIKREDQVLVFRDTGSGYGLGCSLDQILSSPTQGTLEAHHHQDRKRPFADRLMEFPDTRVFNFSRTGKDGERVLVIGNSPIAEETAAVIGRFASEVVHVRTGAEEPATSKREGRVLRLMVPNTKRHELDGIMQEHADTFKALTRAVVFSPLTRLQELVDDSIYHDDLTLETCLNLRQAFRSATGRGDLHIMAEIGTPTNLDLFFDVGIQQAVPANAVIDLILARMVFHGGLVSEFLLKSMSYTPENKKVRLTKLPLDVLDSKVRQEVEGRPYDEVLEILYDRAGIQLIGFVRYSHNGEIIINPRKNSEQASVMLQKEDALFAFVRPDNAQVFPD